MQTVIFLNVNIKLLLNFISAQDISVFDNIAEILLRLPDPENGPAPVTTENFHCGCRYFADDPCSLMFSLEELDGIRCCYLEMSREYLDITMLAQLSCGMHMSKVTSPGWKEGTPRKTQRTDFFHHGQRICRDTSKHMHVIGQD